MPGNGIEPLYMDFQSTALPLSYPSTIDTAHSPTPQGNLPML